MNICGILTVRKFSVFPILMRDDLAGKIRYNGDGKNFRPVGAAIPGSEMIILRDFLHQFPQL